MRIWKFLSVVCLWSVLSVLLVGSSGCGQRWCRNPEAIRTRLLTAWKDYSTLDLFKDCVRAETLEKNRTLPILMEALKDEDTLVRQSAAIALERIGPNARAAVPSLIEALKDQDANVRSRAARALGYVAPDAETVVPPLIEALKDKHFAVRGHATVALGLLGAEAKAAIPALIEALDDKEESVRRGAVKALQQIEGGPGPGRIR